MIGLLMKSLVSAFFAFTERDFRSFGEFSYRLFSSATD